MTRSRQSTTSAPPERLALDFFRRLKRRKAHADLELLALRGRRFSDRARQVLKSLQGDGRLLTETLRDLRRLNTEIDELLAGVQGPFRLFVVGSGNAGKSSTVNALLGTEVAKVEACACTWRIDVFAPRGAGTQLLDINGERLTGPTEDLRKIVSDDEAAREASEIKVQELFRDRRKNVDRTAWKELKEQLRRDSLHHSPWIEAQWGVVEQSQLSGIWLVDTPGLHQEDPLGGEGSQRREAVDGRAREYYQKADGVLWVLDASVLASAGARDAVDQVKAAFDELGSRPENVIAVVNRLDLVGRDPDDPACRRVLDNARAKFGDFFHEIVGFSALLAGPQASAEERRRSGLEELIRAIDRRFRQRAAVTRRQAKSAGLMQLESTLIGRLVEYTGRLEADGRDYDERRKRIRSEAKAIKKAQSKDIEAWRERHEERIHTAIDARLEEAYELVNPAERQRFVGRSIFDLEAVRQDHSALVRSLRRGADRFVERREEDASFSEFRHLKVTAKALSRDFNEVLPADDDVHFSVFSAEFASMLGDIAEWEVVRKTMALLSGSRKREMRDQASQLLEDLADESVSRAQADIKRAEARLIGWLKKTFEGVHLPRDRVENCVAQPEGLRALHGIEYRQSGAVGLVFGTGEQLGTRTRDLLCRLEP